MLARFQRLVLRSLAVGTFVTFCWLLSVRSARADTIFSVSGTFADNNSTPLTGTITINSATGAIDGFDFDIPTMTTGTTTLAGALFTPATATESFDNFGPAAFIDFQLFWCSAGGRGIVPSDTHADHTVYREPIATGGHFPRAGLPHWLPIGSTVESIFRTFRQRLDYTGRDPGTLLLLAIRIWDQRYLAEVPENAAAPSRLSAVPATSIARRRLLQSNMFVSALVLTEDRMAESTSDNGKHLARTTEPVLEPQGYFRDARECVPYPFFDRINLAPSVICRFLWAPNSVPTKSSRRLARVAWARCIELATVAWIASWRSKCLRLNLLSASRARLAPWPQ